VFPPVILDGNGRPPPYKIFLTQIGLAVSFSLSLVYTSLEFQKKEFPIYQRASKYDGQRICPAS
jgi:hypothetical protein